MLLSANYSGYKGMIELAMRDGVKQIDHSVYAGDMSNTNMA